MKVKFKDGTLKSCTTPMEQKVFKSGEPAGWLLGFSVVGAITSEESDALLTADNVSELTFMSDTETEDATVETASVTGYEKISSVIIRHSGDIVNSKCEIQLTKGV